MPEVRVVDSLAEVDRTGWNALFRGTAEDYDYLRAVETAGLAGFSWRYVLVEEAGVLLAAAPAFLTEYALETTLAGPGRRVVEGLRHLAPGALKLRLACLGSPCTETLTLGVRGEVPAERHAGLLSLLLAGFDDAARGARCGLLGLKDVAAPDAPLWEAAAGPLGYRAIAGQPVAHLDIDFASLDDYLGRLSPGTRKDMRRKLRALDAVRVEVTCDVAPVLDRLMTLYAQTRARAEMTFEDLTPAYFQGVVDRMAGRAFCVLYYQGEELLAANLLLQDGDLLLDKFFCMDAGRGRALNLYFLSWFTNLRLCLERGCRRYQSGQAGYETKLRLGSSLTRTSNYFRHRNALVNGGLRLVAPLLAADPTARRAA
jgi:predicted N-acyltransferase